MKVAILSSFPVCFFEKELCLKNLPKKDLAIWTVNLINGLSKYKDIEIHLVTETKDVSKSTNFIKDNVHYHFIKCNKRINPRTFYLTSVYRINKVLKKIKPDIVHAHHTGEYAFAALFCKIPYIVTAHGIYKDVKKKTNAKLLSWITVSSIIEYFCLNKIKYLISINPYIKDLLKKNINKRVKVYDIENPISELFFNVSKNSEYSNKNLILLIASISRLKNIMLILKAINTIKDVFPDIKLEIIGPNTDNSYCLELKDYINKKRLNRHIELIDYLSSENIANKMLVSKFLILTSITETAPTVISEAMVMGLPVIATDVGGVKYMVENGKTGFVVPSNNVNELTEKMLILLKDENLRIIMGKEAKRQAKLRFHPDLVAEKTRNVYYNIGGY